MLYEDYEHNDDDGNYDTMDYILRQLGLRKYDYDLYSDILEDDNDDYDYEDNFLSSIKSDPTLTEPETDPTSASSLILLLSICGGVVFLVIIMSIMFVIIFVARDEFKERKRKSHYYKPE